MNERARSVWARTSLHVWPETYRLVSLPPGALELAVRLAGRASRSFTAIVRERGEVSLTIAEDILDRAVLRDAASSSLGPYRVITFDTRIDPDVTGYLAPAAARLAEAGIPIVAQCGHRTDHILVPQKHLEAAVSVLESLIEQCRGVSGRCGPVRPPSAGAPPKDS